MFEILNVCRLLPHATARIVQLGLRTGCQQEIIFAVDGCLNQRKAAGTGRKKVTKQVTSCQ